jgi:membrane protein YdbS with pleckstrin-like domain
VTEAAPVPEDVSVGGPTAPRSALEPWPDTVAWRTVSPKLITIELLQLATWTAILLIAAAIGWTLTGSSWFGLVVAALLVFAAIRVVTVIRAVRAWGYAEREEDLLVRHGLLVRRLSIVPYARMQFVDVTAGPLERAFGLATVQLHTATAASDARVPGLAPAEASRLRDRLTALGEVRAEGL